MNHLDLVSALEAAGLAANPREVATGTELVERIRFDVPGLVGGIGSVEHVAAEGVYVNLSTIYRVKYRERFDRILDRLDLHRLILVVASDGAWLGPDWRSRFGAVVARFDRGQLLPHVGAGASCV